MPTETHGDEDWHFYGDGIGGIRRWNGVGTPIHYDSMGREVNYISVDGKFVRWIDEVENETNS